MNAKEKLLSFGIYPEVTLSQARTARDAARAMLANGSDPRQAKQARKLQEQERLGHTFERHAKAYLVKAAKEGRATATLAKAEWLLEMAIAAFGKKPMTAITSPIVLACLRKVEAKGHHETARKLRSTIGAVFRLAIASGAAETDPTFALQGALIRPTVTPRAAITDPKALGGVMRAIDGFHGQVSTRIALQLLAILAPRPGENRAAKWSEIDMTAAVWSIPAERMKMRRPHKVPLPGQALNLIEELRPLTGSSDFLFPSLVSPLRSISENTLNTALRRMGIGADEMTSHGFRATFSTLANESGLWIPDAIERALAHIEGNQVRRAYVFRTH